jgi:hypothetical protein
MPLTIRASQAALSAAPPGIVWPPLLHRPGRCEGHDVDNRRNQTDLRWNPPVPLRDLGQG